MLSGSALPPSDSGRSTKSCGSLYEVDYRCTASDIASLIGEHTDTNNVLTVILTQDPGGHRFNIDQLSSLLTTRTVNMVVKTQSINTPAFFDCSGAESNTVDMEGCINVKLERLHIRDCKLSIHQGGNITLDGVSFEANRGRIGQARQVENLCAQKLMEVDIQPSNDSAAVVSVWRSTNIILNSCEFQESSLTPLRIVESDVQVRNSNFLNNAVDGGDLDIQAPISAGIALCHNQNTSEPRLPLHVTISDCIFHNNTVFGDVPRPSEIKERGTLRPAGVAGAALQLLLSSNWSISPSTSSIVTVSNSNFTSNKIRPCFPPKVIAHTGGNLNGGAVGLRLDGSEMFALVTFQNCKWKENQALRGGAFSIGFYGDVQHNGIQITNSVFESNIATGRQDLPLRNDDFFGFGGAVNVEYHGSGVEGCNSIAVENSLFSKNGAAEGGAIHVGFYQPYKNFTYSLCSQISITMATFDSNIAQIGAAISMWGGDDWRLAQEVSPRTSAKNVADGIVVRNCLFQNNVAFWQGSFTVTNLQVAFDGTNRFLANTNSALCLLFARCWLMAGSDVIFSENVGEVGAGLLMQESHFVVGQNTAVYFYNNSALSKGGGVFTSISLL